MEIKDLKMPEDHDPEVAAEKTPEQEKMSMIKRQAQRNVIAWAETYIKTRNKELLLKIQEVVDELDDAFVMMIPQKEGAPYCVTFNPRTAVPEVPSA